MLHMQRVSIVSKAKPIWGVVVHAHTREKSSPLRFVARVLGVQIELAGRAVPSHHPLRPLLEVEAAGGVGRRGQGHGLTVVGRDESEADDGVQDRVVFLGWLGRLVGHEAVGEGRLVGRLDHFSVGMRVRLDGAGRDVEQPCDEAARTGQRPPVAAGRRRVRFDGSCSCGGSVWAFWRRPNLLGNRDGRFDRLVVALATGRSVGRHQLIALAGHKRQSRSDGRVMDLSRFGTEGMSGSKEHPREESESGGSLLHAVVY